MSERPIIFNADMVRAVLEGSKTQTRRIMKVQPSEGFNPLNMALETDFKAHWYTPGVVDKDGYLQPAKKQVFGVASEDEGYACPFGAVGDLLWVRERARVVHTFGDMVSIRFEADGYLSAVPMPERIKPVPAGQCLSNGCYREASRITLEITGVRVERLQDISEEDAIAEGGTPYFNIDWFSGLWATIYGVESWQANPWVWVIEFKRVEGE